MSCEGPDAQRLARRSTTLRTALAGLPAQARHDYHAIATVLVAPGFRPVADEGLPPAVAAHRAERRAVMVGVLDALERSRPGLVPTGLAPALTDVRAGLVHPMTGESLCLLDWVLRGGDPSAALDVIG